MSAYSNLREIFKDTIQMIQGKGAAGRMVYLLKTFSFAAVCLLYLIEKCGFKSMISYKDDMGIGLPQEICDFLSMKNIFRIVIIYLIWFFVWNLIIQIKSQNRCIFSSVYTVEECFEIFFHSVILLKIVQDILQCLKGKTVMQGENLCIYFFVVISAVSRFMWKLYIQNENIWYSNSIWYTKFVDSDGKRISKEDYVVYRNKIYKIYNDQGTWYLFDSGRKTNIKLEDAVIDNEGKLKVYTMHLG